jgi:trk system potassium uptake protein
MDKLKWLERALSLVALLVLILFMSSSEGEQSLSLSVMLTVSCYFLVGLFLIYFALQVARISKHSHEIGNRIFDFFIFIPLVITRGEPKISATLIIFRQILITLYQIIHQERVQKSLDSLQQYPARMLAGSFLILIMVGTLLLALPMSAQGEQGLDLLDALFTATSAACVTGLVVVDTGTYFSHFGQFILLVLMQAGGLGIMALSASAAALLGKRLALGQKVFMQNLFEESDYNELKNVILYIFRFTFISELIGAIILTIRFQDQFDNLLQAAFYGLFHAVSAFCNAGFALWTNSLTSFANDPVVNLVVSTLIILGGLGFTVITPLLMLPRMLSNDKKYSWKNFSMHARMVLSITAFLIVGGMAFILFVEYNHAFLEMSLGDKLWASFFHSVTARTAGFNTIPVGSFQASTVFFFTLLMFIGASPGSTGGGIKTTTAATLLLTARSMIRRRHDVEYGSRRIPEQVITKAIAIFILSLVIIPLGILSLLMTEEAPFNEILFEVISAFGTVGLSLGLTPHLTVIGKVSITLLMFVGRLGPLTVALMAGESNKVAKFRYPRGDIMVG